MQLMKSFSLECTLIIRHPFLNDKNKNNKNKKKLFTKYPTLSKPYTQKQNPKTTKQQQKSWLSLTSDSSLDMKK